MSAATSPPTSAEAGSRRGHARDAAATLVADVHRLIKLAQLHALDNQAVVRQLESARQAVREYVLRAGEAATIFFARGLVFVGSEPLRGSRSAYEAAGELAAFLARAGGNELVFAPEVTVADLRHFVEGIVATLRGGRFAEGPRVRLRAVPEVLSRGLDVDRLEGEQRIVRNYATAVVVMRRFFEALDRGELAMPRRIKRIAQNLVDLSAGRTPAFLGVTAARNANHDEAGRAVNTAILSVAMGRQVTSDPVVLSRLAMSALMFDAGRPRARRAMRIEGDDAPIVAQLGDAAERTLPAGTAAVLTALGRVNEPTIARTVVAYEALSLATGPRHPLYRGVRPATFHARIVSAARAYNDLVTPAPGEPQRPPAEALVTLEERADAAEKTAVRLLQAALGVVPPGTMIELSTGEIGIVIANEGAPILRVVVDASGAIPEAPIELTLGSDARRAMRVVGSDPSFTAKKTAPLPVEAPPISPTPTPPRAVIVASKVDVDATMIDRSPFEAMEASPEPPEAFEPPISGRVALVRRATIPPMKVPPAKGRGSTPPPPMTAAGLALPTGAPDVRGTVARSPLPHLFVHILGRGLTGSLVLQETPTVTHAIVFREGSPTKAHVILRGPRLGDLLVARGDVSASDIVDVVARARAANRPIGKQLVAEGKLGAAQIGTALEAQLDERIAELATLAPETVYLFYEGHDILPSREPYAFDPLPRVLAAARSWRDEGAIDAAVARLGDAPLALHPSADLERFRPTEEERVAVEWAVAGGFDYRGLLAEEIAAPEAVRPIVWTLLATRHIDVGGGHFPLGVRRVQVSAQVALPPKPAAEDDPGRPSFMSLPEPAEGVPSALIVASTPPSSGPISLRVASTIDVRITDADDARRASILERDAAIGSLDAYAVLGVEERADSIAIQRAFLEAVKSFHPDRLPPELSDLQPAAARVFQALTEAHKTLMDPDKRREHDAARARGIALGGEQSEIERVLDASTNFEKSLVMFKRGDSAAAERFAQLAAEGDSTVAEHLALHGYLLALKGGPDATTRALELLDKAASDGDASDRVFFWRGSVRKKLGMLDGAIADFREAAEKNPKNIDAVREVRLFEMRAQKREVAKKSLLSGLFGRRRD
ncbi:MAG: DnaJ domain-containing protein [Polyangiales bacterium]